MKHKKLFSVLCHIAVLAACGTFWLYCVVCKSASGGRWATGMSLSAADRFLAGDGGLYSSIADGLRGSATYFPGGTFAAVIARVLFGSRAEMALVALGGVLAFVAVWAMVYIAARGSLQRVGLGLAALLIVIYQFPVLRSYALEMHPDMPALCFFLLGLLFCDRYLEKSESPRRMWLLIPAAVCFAASGLCKQSAVFLYAGYGLYLLLEKSVAWRDKIFLLGSEFIGGVVVLAAVFGLPNCFLHTVKVNASHPRMSAEDFNMYLGLFYKQDKLFMLILGIGLLLLITRNLRLETRLQRSWAFCSAAWFAFCMFGSLKEGANTGNMEAGLIAFLPFALMTIRDVVSFIFSLFDRETVRKAVSSVHAAPLFGVLLCAVILFGAARYAEPKLYNAAVNAQNSYANYLIRLKDERTTSEWLNANCEGKTVAYTAYRYGAFYNADVKLSSELETVGFFHLADFVSDIDLAATADRLGWDVIVITGGFDETNWPLTFSSFRLLEGEEAPAVPYRIYVRAS